MSIALGPVAEAAKREARRNWLVEGEPEQFAHGQSSRASRTHQSGVTCPIPFRRSIIEHAMANL
jgi:hypothetical protein